MLRSNRPILVGLFETAPCRKPTRYRTLKHGRGTLIGLCGVGAAMLDRFRNRLSAL
jgi:hypothetical protein